MKQILLSSIFLGLALISSAGLSNDDASSSCYSVLSTTGLQIDQKNINIPALTSDGAYAIGQLAKSSDGKLIAAPVFDAPNTKGLGALYLLDNEGNIKCRSKDSIRGVFYKPQFFKDGTIAVTTNADSKTRNKNEIILFNSDCTIKTIIPSFSNMESINLAQGTIVATAAEIGVRFLKTDGTVINTFKTHVKDPNYVRVSEDGKTVVVSSENELLIFDNQGVLKNRIPVAGLGKPAIKNGIVVAASIDGKVYLFDLSGKQLHDPVEPMKDRHTVFKFFAPPAISNDGKTAILADIGRNIFFYNLPEMSLRAKYMGNGPNSLEPEFIKVDGKELVALSGGTYDKSYVDILDLNGVNIAHHKIGPRSFSAPLAVNDSTLFIPTEGGSYNIPPTSYDGLPSIEILNIKKFKDGHNTLVKVPCLGANKSEADGGDEIKKSF